MGYTTEFTGQFEVTPPLDYAQIAYLSRFSETRRMARNLPGEYGVEGEFYVEGSGGYGQGREDNIIDYNRPPRTQPGLWCQWVPTVDGKAIQWNGAEKFYDAKEWIQYIIDNFIAPSGRTLNGTVLAEGEERGDIWLLKVKDNQAEILKSFMFPVDTTNVTSADMVFDVEEYPTLFPTDESSTMWESPLDIGAEREAVNKAFDQLNKALEAEEGYDIVRHIDSARSALDKLREKIVEQPF